jgi:hypothetical protein
MSLFIALLTLLVFLTSSYGFGFAAIKWANRDEISPFPYVTVIGVACLIVIGGILNLAGMAYPAGMYILLSFGLIFFVLSSLARFKLLIPFSRIPLPSDHAYNSSFLDRLLPPALIVVAIIFFSASLLPSNVFNVGDDFRMYILRPVRMLQTGTLSGNPFDLLGLDSLGAQAFLQGFFLLNLPVDYLPALVAVFGFGLAGLLLITTARKFNLNWVYTTAAILTLLVINPQSVNVAALYSGIFVILGLLLTSCLITERLDESGIAKPLGMAVLAGLLIASLVALKSTLLFFAVIYSVFFCLGLFAIVPDKRQSLILSAATGLSAAIAILPWLLLHLPNYVATFNVPSHTATGNHASIFSMLTGNVSELFSTNDMSWGGSMLGYGAIVLELAVLAAAFVPYILSSGRRRSPYQGHSLVAASACVAAIGSYVLDFIFFDLVNAVRYACPVLIATLSFALLTASFNATSNHLPHATQPAPSNSKMAILAGTALVLALFGSDFIDRIERVYTKRTTVSFPINDALIQYNQYAFSEAARQATRKIQYQTEAETKILAWISMPFHLDFARNEIQEVTAYGLLNPWLDLPLDGNPIDLARYFKKNGIRYIMWEYRGYGMKNKAQLENMLHSPYPIYRRMADRNLYFTNMLVSMMTGGSFLYNQNGTVLFDLDQIK